MIHYSKVFFLTAALFFALIWTQERAFALCQKDSSYTPTSDICWDCVFPFRVAGVQVTDGSYVNEIAAEAGALIPVCYCPAPPPVIERVGVPISYWEPVRVIETVETPNCYPIWGGGNSNVSNYYKWGTIKAQGMDMQGGNRETFLQSHFWIASVMEILEIVRDIVCMTYGQGIDLAYISELDAGWMDDAMQANSYPESDLFANMVANLAQIPDAGGAMAGFSLDFLYWVTGSSGNVYPLSGFKDTSQVFSAHEGMAARMQYYMMRNFYGCDPAIWYCACIPTPIWIKHHYRIHVAKPVKSNQCNAFGKYEEIWGAGRHRPYGQNNFLWQQFRKVVCCAF